MRTCRFQGVYFSIGVFNGEVVIKQTMNNIFSKSTQVSIGEPEIG